LKRTTELGIYYKKGETANMVAYTNNNFAKDIDDRKRTSGFVFFLGSGAMLWSSKKQLVVTLSTTETEYIATASCACQCIWIKRIMETLDFNENHTLILCANNSTIQLSKNLVFHGMNKHIDVRFHFLRDMVNNGSIELKHCSSQSQVADIMTKPLKLEQFLNLRSKMGLIKHRQ